MILLFSYSMKNLKEILLTPGITESLFDNDLVKKDVDIDFDTLLNMLFDFGKKHKKLFDKIGAVYLVEKQSMCIAREFSSPDGKGKIGFELYLEVTNVYKNFEDEFKLVPGFQAPRLIVRGVNSDWKYSSADYYTTLKNMRKKHIFTEDDERVRNMSSLIAYAQDYKEVFSIYDKMIEYFCSDEFRKMCEKYINMFESKKCIPGLMVDKMMKEIISKS